MNKVPCKDCKDREIGCHSKCKKYLDFKKDLKKTKAKEKYEKKIFIYIMFVPDSCSLLHSSAGCGDSAEERGNGAAAEERRGNG